MRMFPPGPGGQADTAPWRRWLLPAALMAGFLVLLSLPRGDQVRDLVEATSRVPFDGAFPAVPR